MTQATKDTTRCPASWQGCFTKDPTTGTTPWALMCLGIGKEGQSAIDLRLSQRLRVDNPSVASAKTQWAAGQLVAELNEASVARALRLTVLQMYRQTPENAARSLIDHDKGTSIPNRVRTPSSVDAARSALKAIMQTATEIFPDDEQAQEEAVFSGSDELVTHTLNARDAESRQRLADLESVYTGNTAGGQLIKGLRYLKKNFRIPFEVDKDNALVSGFHADNPAHMRRGAAPVSIPILYRLGEGAFNPDFTPIERHACAGLCLMGQALARGASGSNLRIIGDIQSGAVHGIIGADKADGLPQDLIIVRQGLYRKDGRDVLDAFLEARHEMGGGFPECLILSGNKGTNLSKATELLPIPYPTKHLTNLLQHFAAKTTGMPIKMFKSVTMAGLRKTAAATAGALGFKREVVKILCRHGGCGLRVPNVSIEVATAWAEAERADILAGRYSGAGEVDRIIKILELTFSAMAAVIETVGLDNLPLVPQDGRFFGEVAQLELSGWRANELALFQ